MTRGAKEQNQELFDLFWGLCDETLTDNQAERLNELLRADLACRRALIEFMQIVAGLEWEHSGLGGHSLGPATAEQAVAKLPHESAPQQPSAMAGQDLNRLFIRPFLPLANWLQLGRVVSMSRAVAAMLLFGTLCAGLLVATVVSTSLKRSHGLVEHASPLSFVAKLTGAHDVKWSDEAAAPMVDQLLTEGQELEILSGWAEITFKSRARLVLEGPAKLQIQTAESARLLDGKVATDEFARQVGFTLNTPTGRVVDLGAAFGVAVASDRTMELDVFAGTAEVCPVINFATGGIGPPERVTANQFVRAVSQASDLSNKAKLVHLTTTENHFVRTMRSKTFEMGSQCIGRSERDLAKGTVCILRDPTPNSGRAVKFSFYNVHADVDRWITPLIFAFDRSTGTYRVTGIGQSVLNLGLGLQTVPFQLIVGSADLQAGVHTFGFYHGTIDKTGKGTSASFGPLDFDHVPQADDHSTATAKEACWLFVPGDATPVKLHLDLEFSTAPKQSQIPIWPGNGTFPKERIYSGRMEIITEPDYPQTVPGDFLAVTVQNNRWTR
jgi:hypothetical protein